MKNLEIKAKVDNLKIQENLFKKLGARFIKRGRQVDTYFSILKGRLKLRVFNSKDSELIHYERKESSNQRWSDYSTFHISKPKEFIEFLKRIYNILVVVDKNRKVYRYKNAKIHLDKVVGLGEFIEIEVEVKKGQVQAKKLMNELLKYLNIPQKNFIKKSYSDLILDKKRNNY